MILDSKIEFQNQTSSELIFESLDSGDSKKFARISLNDIWNFV